MISNEERKMTLAATGDSLIIRRISVHGETDLIRIIRDADVRYTNCETTIHDYKGYPMVELGPTGMIAEPYIAEELKWLGFNIVSFANNHTMDYDVEGMLATCDNLRKSGLVCAGAGMNLAEARGPAFLDTAKGRVALISAYAIEMGSSLTRYGMAGESRPDIQGRPGFNPVRFEVYHVAEPEMIEELKRMSSKMRLTRRDQIPSWARLMTKPNSPPDFWFRKRRFVEAGKGDELGIHTVAYEKDVEGNLRYIKDAARRTDFVMMSFHSHAPVAGVEIPDVPASFVPAFARACIDAGADVFVGHGPHVLQGIEIYKGKPIFYSLGNLILEAGAIRKFPADIYEEYGLGLDATPSDFLVVKNLSHMNEGAWISVVAKCTFESGKLTGLKLHPITLYGIKRGLELGAPKLADATTARKIIEQLQRLSAPYGTKIEFLEGSGLVEFKE